MRKLVPLKIGAVWFAVEAEAVSEVVGACRCVPIPHPSPNVRGVLAWHGRAIAVLDLAPLVGGDAHGELEARPRTVVLETSGCTLALPVDLVREVQPVDDESVHAPHVTSMPFSAGEVELLRTPMPILDLDALLRSILSNETRDD